MRSLHTFLLAILLAGIANANGNFPTLDQQQSFIDTYIPLAIGEMQRSEIPASIKIAQAAIESNWGKGITAQRANNFFCVKCNNGWAGDTIQLKDDDPGLSCFRAYTNALESFRNHTDFLMMNRRYHNLFEYGRTDYRSWAKGLKECGYATDSSYDQKLIDLIESNGLYIYDYAVPVANFRVLNSGYLPQKEEAASYAGFGNAGNNLSLSGHAGSFRRYAESGDRAEEPILEAPAYRFESRRPSDAPGNEQAGSRPPYPNETPYATPSNKTRRKIIPITPLPENYLERGN